MGSFSGNGRAAGGILSHSFTLKIIFHIMNKCMENYVSKGCGYKLCLESRHIGALTVDLTLQAPVVE